MLSMLTWEKVVFERERGQTRVEVEEKVPQVEERVGGGCGDGDAWFELWYVVC